MSKAAEAGARLTVALKEIPLSLRTWRRWQKSPEDRRPLAVRPKSANRLTPEEEQQILAVYTGAMVLISHDAQFIANIGNMQELLLGGSEDSLHKKTLKSFSER
ncbi:hypothetical protein L7G72_04730 [Xenorhabdus bovienii]|uniref:hypothetical protein n=1 Tax=Xenorhabdus bovienii TaxID=40576 RepID=UPI001EE14C7B|nr:hypothetical protein [Xenorhabdus bovienii]MCG3461170.1 hypothetical protein [Xenorhabdus bovienii]